MDSYASLLRKMLLALLALGFAQAAWAGDWNLKDRDGAQYALSGLRGKWVLVNFWAPWCPSCIQEMPDLGSLQRARKDVQVIGVAVMYENRKDVLSMAARQSVSYPIVFGNEDTAADFGGLDGLPTSFLYSPAGKLVGHHQGPLTLHELERAIGREADAAGLFTR